MTASNYDLTEAVLVIIGNLAAIRNVNIVLYTRLLNTLTNINSDLAHYVKKRIEGR